MATLTNQIDNLNKRVVALENSELSGTEAVPFIVKLYADFEVAPALYCSDGGYSDEKMELIIDGEFKEVTNKVFNGDYNEGITGWYSNGATGTLTISNNELKHTITNVQAYAGIAIPSAYQFPVIANNQYFISYFIKPFRYHLPAYYLGGNYYFATGFSAIANQWNEVFVVKSVASPTNNLVVFSDNSVSTTEMTIGKETYYKSILIINLTEEFGAGNEPTAAEMKAAIDEYRARVYPECSEDLELTAGASGTAEELGEKINYSAIGNSTLPTPGDTGVVGEVARKPIGLVTNVESSDTESVIVFSSYFDEQAANGELLTSAAVLFSGTEISGTGTVIASEIINIDKTSAKTLTVSTEITITEVV